MSDLARSNAVGKGPLFLITWAPDGLFQLHATKTFQEAEEFYHIVNEMYPAQIWEKVTSKAGIGHLPTEQARSSSPPATVVQETATLS